MTKRSLVSELSTVCSDSSLSKILEKLDVPGSSRWSVARAVKRDIERQTAYGPSIQKVNLPLVSPSGGSSHFVWEFCNPFATLNLIADSSESFRRLVADTLAKRPSSRADPWRICAYTDEVVPGNLLALNHSRKIHVLYWTFLDFGMDILSREEAWIFGGCIRSNIASGIAGGLSCVVKHFLLAFFASGCNIASAGCSVASAGAVIFANVSAIIGDEDALKRVSSVKGAAGLKPCSFCKNLVLARSRLLEHADARHGSYLVDLNCLDEGLLDLHTDKTFLEAVDMLDSQSKTLSKAEFHQLEVCLGMNHHPESLWRCHALREWVLPVTSVMLDWMHIYLVHGVASHEFHMFLGLVDSRLNIRFADIRKYCAAWQLPQHLQDSGIKVADMFSEKRRLACEAAGLYKGSASELLTLYPVLRHFVAHALGKQPEIKLQSASLLNLCRVLDCLQAVKMGVVSGADLRPAVLKHLRSFRKAYPEFNLKPKHHYAMHLAHLLETHQMLLSCFVHERKHRAIKKCASEVTNLRSFEKAVTLDVLNHHLESLQNPWVLNSGVYLEGGRHQTGSDLLQLVGQKFPGAVAVSSSRAAVNHGNRCSKGDFVLLSGTCGAEIYGQVEAHLAIQPAPSGSSGCYSIVHVYETSGLQLNLNHYQTQLVDLKSVRSAVY